MFPPSATLLLSNLALKTMAVSGVMVANIFTGMATAAWTWWLAFSVSFGIVLVWGFTVSQHIMITSGTVYPDEHVPFPDNLLAHFAR